MVHIIWGYCNACVHVTYLRTSVQCTFIVVRMLYYPHCKLRKGVVYIYVVFTHVLLHLTLSSVTCCPRGVGLNLYVYFCKICTHACLVL
jgi:hypothetical protein